MDELISFCSSSIICSLFLLYSSSRDLSKVQCFLLSHHQGNKWTFSSSRRMNRKTKQQHPNYHPQPPKTNNSASEGFACYEVAIWERNTGYWTGFRPFSSKAIFAPRKLIRHLSIPLPRHVQSGTPKVLRQIIREPSLPKPSTPTKVQRFAPRKLDLHVDWTQSMRTKHSHEPVCPQTYCMFVSFSASACSRRVTSLWRHSCVCWPVEISSVRNDNSCWVLLNSDRKFW